VRRGIGIASQAQQQMADLISHYLLHHESSLSCIEAQGGGQTMTDPIRQSFQGLPNPLAFQEGRAGDLLSRNKLASTGVEVVLCNRCFQGL
jgi:hypothetical protein